MQLGVLSAIIACAVVVAPADAMRKRQNTSQELKNIIEDTTSGPDKRIRKKISGGFRDPWSNFDWVVQLKIGSSVCTGTISGQYVLTAAHCIYNKREADIAVTTADRITRQASWISWHPQYYEESGEKVAGYDVAVIKLTSSYTPKKAVRIASRTTLFGQEISVRGWGLIGPSGQTRFNQRYDIDSALLTTIPCGSMSAKNSHTLTCATSGGSSRDSLCQGDSGGPFVLGRNPDQVVITGVSAFVEGKCGDFDAISGFTNTGQSDIRRWILENAPSFA